MRQVRRPVAAEASRSYAGCATRPAQSWCAQTAQRWPATAGSSTHAIAGRTFEFQYSTSLQMKHADVQTYRVE